MRRFLGIIIFLFGLILFLPSTVFSSEEFATDVAVEYIVEETGITVVTHKITIQNLFSELYATSYTLSLDNIEPQKISAFEGSKPLSFTTKKDGDKTSITVAFPDANVGKDKIREFSVVFEESSFATRTGEVWEVSIPRLAPSESFRSYKVFLSIPNSFGTEAYVSPKPQEVTGQDGNTLYSFDKSSVQKTGVTAGFGAFQVFSFTLNYHLENPLAKTASVDIALPPDTALQRIYYQNLNPKPDNVYADTDGNWLATYILKARERIDVEAKGAVQIFSGPRPFPKPTDASLSENLKPTEFWQSDDAKITSLAKSLKTPRAIYDYVWQNLKYDYERVKPNVVRAGAKAALENPESAICMEFTDLFIALSRAAGIPAREINGFAYTENPKIQPLSLVADVLHSWPEYWDKENKVWVPIDPTWASTTGGIDFFSKLDLRHFTFVIHGKDDQKPYAPGSYKLGPNPQKDVFVNFGQLPEERVGSPEIEVTAKNRIPFSSAKYEIKITNPGPVALYNITPTINFNGQISDSAPIEILPPFGIFKTKAVVPYSFLGRDTPDKITVAVGDKQVQVTTNKRQIITESLTLLSIFLLVLVLVILIKLRKIQFSKIKGRIQGIFTRRKKNDKQENFPKETNIPPTIQ